MRLRAHLSRSVLFWVSLAALAWTHVALPGGRVARSRGSASAGSRKGDVEPTVTVVVAAYNEETRDRAPDREPARARLSARQARARRLERRLERPHRGDRAAVPGRDGDPRTRAAARSRRRTARCARPTARSSRSRTRTARGRRTRCARSCAPFADPDVAYVCGQLRILARRRLEQGGRSTGATSSRCATPSRGSRSVTGGNGSIYAVRRSDYVEVDPRFGHDLSLPYLMVQRGRRAVYEPAARRVREADADERDGVPAQGADVRALLADRPARAGCSGGSAAVLRRRDRLAPAPALRVRAAAPRPARDARSRSSRTAGSTTSSLGAQLGAARRRARSASGSRATTCSSRGRRSSRSGTTCAAACRRRGRPAEGTR